MSKRKRLSYKEKLKACELYRRGKGTMQSIADEFNISNGGFKLLYFKYENFGPETLRMTKKNQSYTIEFKEKVIKEYRTGKYAYKELAIKYGVPNFSLIASWVLGYNNSNKTTNTVKGGVTMNGRKTTLNERIDIIQYLIENNNDYNNTSLKFKVSYQQVYQWYQKYLNNGVDGLVDNRGRKKQNHDLDDNELLRRENRKLIKALELSKAEIEVLKKNEALHQKARLTELDIKKSMKR